MDYEDYQAAHVALWDWLANNPGKDKYDWPGWEEGSSIHAGAFAGQSILNHCFLCEWYRRHGGCEACACTKKYGEPCFSDINPNSEGLFKKWDKAMQANDFEEACRLAVMMRDVWEY